MNKFFNKLNFLSASFLFLCVLFTQAEASVKIGVIGAMDVEIGILKQSAKINNTVTKAGMYFYEGTIGSQDVVIARCGMGKVNSGVCAQILIDTFKVTHVINTGTAGTINSDYLNVGGIIIGTEAIQYDFDVTPIGYKIGEIPYTGLYAFPLDEGMREKLLASATKIAPDRKIITGQLFTGDRFLTDQFNVNRLKELFGGQVCDMESAAIAQVCYLNSIPCAVARCISDAPDDYKNENFKDIEKIASETIAAVVVDMITNYRD